MNDEVQLQALRLQDTRARRIAQVTFDRPIVLEAGAGTGKTTALVARILSWSMGAGWKRSEEALSTASVERTPEAVATRTLSRIVAITFTEAAAAEMGERVSEALLQIADGEVPEGVLEEILPADPDERQRRAAALLSCVDNLPMRTVHAFCRRLLANHPLEAGLHPNFEVDADGVMLEDLVRAVVLEHTQVALSLPIDPDFRRLFALGHQPQALFSTLLKLAQSAAPPKVLAEDPLSPARVEALMVRLRHAAEALRAVLGSRLESASRSPSSLAVVTGLELLISRLTGSVYLSQLVDWVGELFPPALLSRLASWKKGRLNNTEKVCLAEVQDALEPAADALQVQLKHILRLDPELLDLGRRVLHPMLQEVHRRMRSSGVQTFTALLVDARALLMRRDDVRDQIQQGIDQLLVDEFQDTDILQCDVVRRLGLQGESRPGLFIVGDPKQSIYGWRNADLRAYDAFVEEVLAAGGERHTLSLNFRSVPGILDEVTRVVAPVMHREEGFQPVFEPLIASRSEAVGFTDGDRAPVEHWNSMAFDDGVPQPDTRSEVATDLEAAALAADLRELHDAHGVPWSDVGLLMRNSGDLERYLRHLREARIPYIVERDRSYYRRREIIAAAAMVRSIFDPNDHIALIGFLRSSACGLPDAALLPLWSRGFPGLMTAAWSPEGPEVAKIRTVITAVAEELREQVGTIPGLDRILGWEHSVLLAIGDLIACRQDLLRLPADVFVARLRARLMLEVTEAARYQGAYRIANLDRFYRRLQAAMEEGGDLEAVLKSLRRSVAEVVDDAEGRPKDTVEDALSVMTIHSAKGLAFGHVYLLQTHRTGNHASVPFTAIERPRDPGQSFEMVLFGAPSPGWDEIERYQGRVASAERIRLLYVAMTRARDRLVVAGRWRGEPLPWSQARCISDLLSARSGGLPRPSAMAEQLDADQTDRVSAAGVSWVFPACTDLRISPAGAHPGSAALPKAADVLGTAARLAAARKDARVHARRLRGGEAWAEPAAAEHEELAWSVPGVPGRATIPQAVGTAIHRAMAALDLRSTPDTERTRLTPTLADHIRPLLRAEEVSPAVRRAEGVLFRVLSGGWLQRLAALSPDIKARALPLLLPPPGTEGAPVGFLSGEIDLLYTDPESGELVVADFKTDDIPASDVPARAEAYRAQGAAYCSAVAAALALPERPRHELWFLLAGETVRL